MTNPAYEATNSDVEKLIKMARINAECGEHASPEETLRLIAALEQARTEREEFRKRLKLERQIVEDADKRIAELESAPNGMMQLSNELADKELTVKALALYKPPFKFMYGYIHDGDGRVVADNNVGADNQVLRVRGWGRISYMENAEALQDEVGEVIAFALTEYWQKKGAL
ncbi:UNVERIFIED_ORG: hypothetical protein J2Y78_003821 [Buttiauxella agrestis ATCC 33320]